MAIAVSAKPLALKDLEHALAAAWSRDTSADPGGWAATNPAWGQCAVTALIVQHYLGGELRRGEAGQISHYWNVLPSGQEIDLTRGQFAADVEITNIQPRTREYLLSHPDTARRYAALAQVVGRSVRGAGCQR